MCKKKNQTTTHRKTKKKSDCKKKTENIRDDLIKLGCTGYKSHQTTDQLKVSRNKTNVKNKNKKNKKKGLHTNLRRFAKDLANATPTAWFDEDDFKKKLVGFFSCLFFFFWRNFF